MKTNCILPAALALLFFSSAISDARAQSASTVKETRVITDKLLPTLSAKPELSSFADAIQKSGLSAKLNEKGPFTVLAPNNEAFRKLNESNGGKLTGGKDNESLQSMMNYLIVGKLVSPAHIEKAAKATGQAELTALNGGKIEVLMDGSDFWVRDAHGKKSKVHSVINSSNGIIYVIDEVLTQ